LIGSVDQLGLVEAVDRLSKRVIERIPDRPDRRDGDDLGKPFPVTHRCELRPGVGMRDEAVEAGAALPTGHLECVEDHGGAHVRCDTPTHDATRERIDDEAHIGDTGPGRHIGQIHRPEAIRRVGSEVPLHQISRPRSLWVGSGRVVRTRLPRRTPWIPRAFIRRAV